MFFLITYSVLAEEIQIDYHWPEYRSVIAGSEILPGMEGVTHLNTFMKRSPENEIIYCGNGNLSIPGNHLTDDSVYTWDLNCKRYDGNISKSLAYVYENGYGSFKKSGEYSNNNYLTGSPDVDYFITQAVVWELISEVDNSRYINTWMPKCNFKTGNGLCNNQSNDATQKIAKLYQDAKAAATGPAISINVDNKNMSLTSDKKYYISAPMTLNGAYLSSDISVSVSGVSGAFVTGNANGTSHQSSYAVGSTVYIKIPTSSVNNGLATVTMTASAKSKIVINTIMECSYRDDPSVYQPVITYLPGETLVSTSVSVTTPKLTVTISKQDVAGSAEIPGAELKILDKNNREVTKWTSGTSPHQVSLDPGTYTLEETIAPKGYIKSTSRIQFIVNGNGTVTVGSSVGSSVVMKNEPIMVEISKKSITDKKELAGAKLRILDEKGSLAKDIEGNSLEWTSDGKTKKFHLAAGTYFLAETKAPDGYKLIDTKVKFVVGEDGKVTVDNEDVKLVAMFNNPIIVKISKKSITGSDEVVGATLQITDEDGKVLKDMNGKLLEWVSEEKPKEFNLKAGTYFLHEKIAPEGYELSETVVVFVVTSTGRILVDGREVKDDTVIFKNTPEPEPVPTGDAIIYISIVVGVIALGVLAYFIIRKYKK